MLGAYLFWKDWKRYANVRVCILEVYPRKGLNHLIYEIVDNAVDEHLAGYCSLINVVLEKDGSCTVTDNGRGIPVDMHEKGMSAERLVFTTLHAGGKFDNSAYKTSGGLHGVGSSVVNALSTYLDIKVSRDGYVHHDHYETGSSDSRTGKRTPSKDLARQEKPEPVSTFFRIRRFLRRHVFLRQRSRAVFMRLLI